MELKNFDVIFEKARNIKDAKKVVIAGAESKSVVDGAFECAVEKLATPILVGNKNKIESLIEAGNWGHLPYEIVATEKGEDPCIKAVELVADGYGDCLMKGLVETADFLRPIMSRKYGLRTSKVVSQIGFSEVPGYHKLVALTDGAILTYPDLETKQHVVENLIMSFHALGVETPNIAMLGAVEFVNPAIPDTIESNELVDRWKSGVAMQGCNLAGPLAYDLIFSQEAAEVKGIDCSWCGDFDGIVAPNIVVANTLGKCWKVTMNVAQGGVVIGAKVPVLISSRSTDAEDRLRTMAVAVAVAEGMKNL